jgi:hypothetical protein
MLALARIDRVAQRRAEVVVLPTKQFEPFLANAAQTHVCLLGEGMKNSSWRCSAESTSCRPAREAARARTRAAFAASLCASCPDVEPGAPLPARDPHEAQLERLHPQRVTAPGATAYSCGLRGTMQTNAARGTFGSMLARYRAAGFSRQEPSPGRFPSRAAPGAAARRPQAWSRTHPAVHTGVIVPLLPSTCESQ